MRVKDIYAFLILLSFSNFCLAQMFGTAQLIDGETASTNVLITADLDNDNDLDILTAASGMVAWYENLNGLGTFGGAIPIQEGMGQTFSATVADFDDDNRLDVVVSYFDEDMVLWYKNLGSGTFSPGQLLASGLDRASGVASGDFSGDNDPDLVLGVSNGQGLYWIENLPGSGNFSSPITIDSTIPQARQQAIGDIDGDTDLDFVTNTSSGNLISWFENTDGNGDFSIQQAVSTAGAYENYHELADVDGDDDLDIISNTLDDFLWRENTNGLGTFSNVQNIDTAGGAKSFGRFRTADLDEDDDLDAVMVSPSTKVNWYENLDGDGSFSSRISIDDTIEAPSRIAVGDLDNDGDQDIVVSSVETNGDKILVWYENRTILGIDQFDDSNISISPNPVEDSIYIKSKNLIEKVSLFDFQGRLLSEYESGFDEINMSGFSSGILFVIIETERHTFTRKLVKN